MGVLSLWWLGSQLTPGKSPYFRVNTLSSRQPLVLPSTRQLVNSLAATYILLNAYFHNVPNEKMIRCGCASYLRVQSIGKSQS